MHVAFNMRSDGQPERTPKVVLHCAEHSVFIWFGFTSRSKGGLNFNLFDGWCRNSLFATKRVKEFLQRLNDALATDPELRCPLRADAEGWRGTINLIFKDEPPQVEATTAYMIARGQLRKSITSELHLPQLRKWISASVYGDANQRFSLQPISFAHYLTSHGAYGGAMSRLSTNHPPNLQARWLASLESSRPSSNPPALKQQST